MPILIKGSGGAHVPDSDILVENDHNHSRDMFVAWKDLDGTQKNKRLSYGESVTVSTNEAFVVAGGGPNIYTAYTDVKLVSVAVSSDALTAYAITPLAESCKIVFK